MKANFLLLVAVILAAIGGAARSVHDVRTVTWIGNHESWDVAMGVSSDDKEALAFSVTVRPQAPPSADEWLTRRLSRAARTRRPWRRSRRPTCRRATNTPSRRCRTLRTASCPPRTCVHTAAQPDRRPPLTVASPHAASHIDILRVRRRPFRRLPDVAVGLTRKQRVPLAICSTIRSVSLLPGGRRRLLALG